MRTRWLLLCWLALLAGCTESALPQSVQLTLGSQIINAEVAATPEAQERGLMHRTSLAPNGGMLFVFPKDAIHCMWMKNTLIPLSVAFMAADGRILNVAEMQPESLTIHCAASPARYALEMEGGWFAKQGGGKGQTITGLASTQ